MPNDFLIDPEIIKKDCEIPKLIAKLSYHDKEAAIIFIRKYGEMTVPVTPLYEEVIKALAYFVNDNEEKVNKESEQKIINSAEGKRKIRGAKKLTEYLESINCPMSTSTIYRLLRTNDIPHSRPSTGVLLFDLDDIDQWLRDG
ncbi:helix-turn-helix transcriptional regulator [Oceanobacillus jeddahense]|uniref:Helix-turn-helix domain-containing protein n=1 Tax=Oceanobacillus jeddahense TaxID=1462527 RepID=A0ABY5JRE1_9BACI|nr:helix-turn-helix domain-containing protein [Oceanobacillus jeddahense]UUI01748.1 helix-turn-helix domain-containing protein [Oceanobacillus jeddahense]